MSYKFTYTGNWVAKSNKILQTGLALMATDIHRMAVGYAPYDSGDLKRSGRFQKKGTLRYVITFGNGKVPYARLREYENHLHPNRTHYLRKAGLNGARRADNYFRKAGTL